MPMTLDEALKIIHSLGHASKMPCWTYSISAKRCKRGSKLAKIPGSVCNKCYARRGNFCRPTIKAGLDARMRSMKHPRWSEAMAIVLTYKEHTGHFRWYSSGDMQSLGDLLKICDVAKRTPHIKHWLPTHEIGILSAFKRAGFTYPDNLIVRLSADMIDELPSEALMRQYGVLGLAVGKASLRVDCPAHQQGNFCLLCRRCWDKTVSVVTLKYH